MASVPDSLLRKLTLTWEDGRDFNEATAMTALGVIEWLNDPENRAEAQALLEPFETECQVELLEDLSQEAHKIVVTDDDTVVIAQAIGVMQLLEDLVNAARDNTHA